MARADELARLCERHGGALNDYRAAADLLWSAAEHYRSVQDASGERRCLLKALERDPSHRRALQRGFELAEQRQSPTELAHLLDLEFRRAHAAGETRAAARAAYRLGELWEQQLGDLTRAIGYHQQAFKTDPELTEAIEAGRRIYRLVGRWHTVADLYQVELATVSGAQRRLELLLELGELQRDRLGDAVAAAESYNAAVQLNPGDESLMESLGELYASPAWPDADGLARAASIFLQLAQRKQSRGDRPGAIAYLRRALGTDPTSEAATSRLERAYRESGRWEDLDRLYRQRLSVAGEAEAVQLQLRRGELLERKLGDRKGARECYEAVLDNEPVGGPAESRLRELYRNEGDHEKLLGLGERALAATTDQSARIQLMLDLAELHRDSLDDPEAAAQLVHEVLQLEPQNRKGLAAYEDYFRNKGDYRNLAELLRYAAHAGMESGAPPMEVCARLEELAEVCERRLGDLPAAAEAWQQIAQLHHNVGRAREAIRRLHAKMERWQELADRLQLDVERAVSPGERVDAIRRMAQVFHDKQIDPLRTIELLREVLGHDPNDQAAQRMLTDLYQREADDAGLAWALRQQLEGILTREERIDVLRRLGALYAERLDEPRDALWAYQQLLELTPHDGQVLDQLRKLLERSGDLPELARLLERRAQYGATVEERAKALRELAQLNDDQLAAPLASAGCWEQLLEIEPDATDALEALTRIYRTHDRPDRLAEALARLLAQPQSSSTATRAKLLRQLAEITDERLSQPEQALHYYEQLLEALPADRGALDALARLYAALGRYGELVDVLNRQITLSSDTEEQVALAFKQVDILEEKLGDDDGAASVLERILGELSPGDLDAHRRLKQLYLRRGDHASACEIAERELFLLPDDEQSHADRLQLTLEIADRWWEQLREVQRATAAYERVLLLDRDNPRALTALRKLYHRTESYHRLVEMAPALFGAISDERERQVLLFEMAEVWEQRLGDPKRAFEWYQRAFDLYPADGAALSELQRVAEQHGLWSELLGIYEQQRSRCQDKRAELEITLRMASLCDEQLDEADHAFELLRDAVISGADSDEVLQQIELLADRAELYRPLYAVYAELLQRCDSAARRHELLRRRAHLAESQLDDPSAALDDLVQLFGERPNAESQTLLSKIEQLSASTGRWDRALAVHRARLRRAEDDGARLEVLDDLAAMLEEHVAAPERAFTARLVGLLLAPDDRVIRSELWRLASALDARSDARATAELFTEADTPPQSPAAAAGLDAVRTGPQPVPPSPAVTGSAGLGPPTRPSLPQPPIAPPRLTDPRTADVDSTMELELDSITDIQELDPDDSAVIELGAPPSPGLSIGAAAAAVPLPPPPVAPPRPSPPQTFDEDGLPRLPPGGDTPWARIEAVFRQLMSDADPGQRMDYLLELGRMWIDGADQLERSFAVLTEAATVDPNDPRPIERLEHLASACDARDRLVQAYRELIEQATERSAITRLRMRVGALLAAAGERSAAEEQFTAVLEIEPTHPEAVEALREIYLQADQPAPLAALVEQQLRLHGDQLAAAERQQALGELADLYQHRLQRVDEAAVVLARLAAERPGDAQVLERLAALYTESCEWSPLVESLQQLLEQTDDERRRAELQLRLARVYERELELPDRAIACYQSALHPELDASEPLEALQRLYSAHGQLRELVGVLARRADACEEHPDQERQLRVQLASAHDRLDELDPAIEQLQRARELGEPDGAIDEQLARLLVRDGQVGQAVGVLQERVDQSVEEHRPPAEVIDLLTRLARLQEEQLGDRDSALATLERALAIDDTDPVALRELLAIQQRRGAWDHYANVALHLAAQLDDEEAADLLRAAAAPVTAEDPARARELLEAARTRKADDPALIDALLQMATDAATREQLLRAKLELLDEPKARAELYVALARLERERGDPGPKQIALLGQALDLAPDLVPAIDAMSTLLLDAGKVDGARELLQSSIERLRATDAVKEAGHLCYLLGQLFDRDGRHDEGARYLRDALRVQPKDLLVRLALGQNRFRARLWREALRHLRAALDHDDATHHPELAADALYAAGECERRLRRPAQALPLLEAALRYDPDHRGALKELATASLDAGKLDRAAELLEGLARNTDDPGDRRDLLERVAEIYRDRLDREADAVRVYEQMLELLVDPDASGQDARASELLEQILPVLEDAGRHAAAGRAARQLGEMAEAGSPERLQFLLAAGRHLVEAGDQRSADACWNLALAEDEACSEAVHGLARSHEAQRQPREGVELLVAHLSSTRTPTDPEARNLRAEIYDTLARLYRKLDDVPRATEALERRVALVDDMNVRRELAKLYAQQPQRAMAALANHRALARDIHNTESLQALALSSVDSAPYRAYCIYSALRAMDRLDEPGRRFVADYQPLELDPADNYAGQLDESERSAQLTEHGGKLARWVFNLLWEARSQLLERDLADYGVSGDDRVSPVERSDLARIYTACSRALGVKTAGLYLREGGDRTVEITATARPAVIVSRELSAGASPALLRFLLGRALDLTRPSCVFVAALPHGELARLLSDVLRAFHPRFTRKSGAPADGFERADKLRRSFPYKIGRRLGELFREHATEHFDSAAWRQAVVMSSNRAGLSLCGDVDVAIAQLRLDEPELAELAVFPDGVDRSPVLRDLLCYATSEAYYASRVQLGLAGS